MFSRGTVGVFNFLALYLRVTAFLLWHVIPFLKVRGKGFLKPFFGLVQLTDMLKCRAERKKMFRFGRPFLLFGQQTAHLHWLGCRLHFPNF